jgi:hypothetical protein
MELKLENPALVGLDGKIFSLNKRYSMALNSLGKIPNLHASSEIIMDIDRLIDDLKKSEAKSEFDSLFIKNSIHNLETQKAYLDYFTTASNVKIDDLMKAALGEKGMKIITDNCRNFNYKSYWELFLSYQEYSYKQLPSDAEEFREKLKKILSDLKQDILDYAERNFNLPKTYDFDLVLGPPYSGRTFFHPTTRRMEISTNQFFIFKDSEEIKINVCPVIESLFHEVIGHGRHEHNSRDLPLTLQDNSVNTSIVASHVHSEGVAQITRDSSIDFMKEHAEKYMIEDDYIRQSVLSSTAETANSFKAFYQYLKLKSFEDSSFDIEKNFKEVTNNYGLFMLYSSSPDSPISCVFNSTYPVGLFYMRELLEDLRKELGADLEKMMPKVNRMISTGMWNFRVLPEFVRLALKKR